MSFADLLRPLRPDPPPRPPARADTIHATAPGSVVVMNPRFREVLAQLSEESPRFRAGMDSLNASGLLSYIGSTEDLAPVLGQRRKRHQMREHAGGETLLFPIGDEIQNAAVAVDTLKLKQETYRQGTTPADRERG